MRLAVLNRYGGGLDNQQVSKRFKSLDATSFAHALPLLDLLAILPPEAGLCGVG